MTQEAADENDIYRYFELESAAEQDRHLRELTERDPATAAKLRSLLKTDGDEFDIREPDRAEPLRHCPSDYRLKFKIGAGGFSEVYEAVELASNRTVAIKFLNEGESAEKRDEAALRARREYDALQRIDSPYTPNAYGLRETEAGPVLILERVRPSERREGHLSLRDIINANCYSRTDALRWLGQLVEAIASIHAVSMIHRDLKPENILVAHDDNIRVIDFGTAHIDVASAPRITRGGVKIGTYGYAPPANKTGSMAARQWDFYEFGVIAFELCTGRRPELDETLYEVLGPKWSWFDRVYEGCCGEPVQMFDTAQQLRSVWQAELANREKSFVAVFRRLFPWSRSEDGFHWESASLVRSLIAIAGMAFVILYFTWPHQPDAPTGPAFSATAPSTSPANSGSGTPSVATNNTPIANARSEPLPQGDAIITSGNVQSRIGAVAVSDDFMTRCFPIRNSTSAIPLERIYGSEKILPDLEYRYGDQTTWKPLVVNDLHKKSTLKGVPEDYVWKLEASLDPEHGEPPYVEHPFKEWIKVGDKMAAVAFVDLDSSRTSALEVRAISPTGGGPATAPLNLRLKQHAHASSAQSFEQEFDRLASREFDGSRVNRRVLTGFGSLIAVFDNGSGIFEVSTCGIGQRKSRQGRVDLGERTATLALEDVAAAKNQPRIAVLLSDKKRRSLVVVYDWELDQVVGTISLENSPSLIEVNLSDGADQVLGTDSRDLMLFDVTAGQLIKRIQTARQSVNAVGWTSETHIVHFFCQAGRATQLVHFDMQTEETLFLAPVGTEASTDRSGAVVVCNDGRDIVAFYQQRTAAGRLMKRSFARNEDLTFQSSAVSPAGDYFLMVRNDHSLSLWKCPKPNQDGPAEYIDSLYFPETRVGQNRIRHAEFDLRDSAIWSWDDATATRYEFDDSGFDF